MSKKWKNVYYYYKKEWLKVNPDLNNNSGIYFLTRIDENEIKYFYIGQSIHVLDRLISHMSGFQHIDQSLKKHNLYSNKNPHGWKVGFLEYPIEELDKWENYWILKYARTGWQCKYNKTLGKQGEGKEKINDYKPTKTYQDGLIQGRKNASKEISHLFDLHLNVSKKSDKPNKNQDKAMKKFKEFLEFHRTKNRSK